MKEKLKKWKNLEFHWDPLIYEDIEELLEMIIPKLKEMERKNNWDLCINNNDLPIFINQAFLYMSEILNPLEFEEWEQYPKQKDFYALWNIINEEIKDEKIDRENKETIWKIVTDKIKEIAKEILI